VFPTADPVNVRIPSEETDKLPPEVTALHPDGSELKKLVGNANGVPYVLLYDVFLAKNAHGLFGATGKFTERADPEIDPTSVPFKSKSTWSDIEL
jgi:hypothetical protein